MQDIDISKIRLLEVAINQADIHTKKEKLDQGESIDIGFDAKAHLNNEHLIILIKFNTSLSARNNPETDQAFFDCDFTFQVENLAEFLDQGSDDQANEVMNTPLGHTLMNIVFSTVRGIVLAKTSGTIFQKSLLPVLDAGQVFKF